MDTTSVFEAWKDFEARMVPHGAGHAQRRDMFIAFMGGAMFVRTLLDLIAILPEAIGLTLLERPRAELECFHETMHESGKKEH